MEWQPHVEMSKQVFPSLIVATATLKGDPGESDPALIGDPSGLIGAGVTGVPAGATLRLVVKARTFPSCSPPM